MPKEIVATTTNDQRIRNQISTGLIIFVIDAPLPTTEVDIGSRLDWGGMVRIISTDFRLIRTASLTRSDLSKLRLQTMTARPVYLELIWTAVQSATLFGSTVLRYDDDDQQYTYYTSDN